VKRAALLALLALLALMGSLGARTGLAQTRYVGNQFKIGIHADKTLASPILGLVASGTPLEELSRADPLVQVRTADGITGWVDGTYLTDEPPAEVRISEAVAARDQARSELERSQADNADLSNRLKEMESRARAAEQSLLASQREATPKARAAEAAAAATSDALREMQGLAEQNQKLKQRIAELEAVQAMAAEQPPATPPRADPAPAIPAPRPATMVSSDNPYAPILAWPRWIWLLLGSVALLALALGAYLVDWSTRRRHGGFRI